MSVFRFDAVELRLDKAETTPEGWLRVPAAIGRVGVFPYRRADGSVRWELRPEDEVFHDDAVRSFSALPLTNDHPTVRLDSTNVQQHQVGQVGTPRRDGDHLVADVLITNPAAIEAARAGKRQLSPGYTVHLDETPGIWRGQHYDAIQRRPRGNHVAQVAMARQGPTVSLRMDSGDAVAITDHDHKDTTMKKIKLDDGTEVEVTEGVATLIEKLRADAKDKPEIVEVKLDSATFHVVKADADAFKAAHAKFVEGMRGDKDGEEAALRARLDAVESQLKTVKAEARADAVAFADALANARVIVSSDFKADTLEEVMAAVVVKLDESAKAKLDEHKDQPGYLRARYEVALEQHKARKDHGTQLLAAATRAGAAGADQRQDEAAKAKAKAEKERADAWKAPAAG